MWTSWAAMADWRRLWPAVVLTALAGCGGPSDDPVPQAAAIIPCAVNGASDLAEECIAELIERDGQRQIVVRHPDGASRRFNVLGDGRGLALADDTRDAVIAVDGTGIRVAVDRDRYSFPAMIFAHDTQ